MRTIDDVIADLDADLARCREERSRRGYFAALYRLVTIEVRDAIAAGAFDDGPGMERLDVVFAGRYLEALEAWEGRGPITRTAVWWRVRRHEPEDPRRVIDAIGTGA